MRIGLLNPWTNAAENQLVPIITRVGEMLGHAVVECKNSRDILDHRPDFVLALSRTQPKLTDVPTYGILFDPRTILVDQPSYLASIFTWDGILTIFDSLRDLASDMMIAARRDVPLGYFYPTCMRMEWDRPIDFASAHLAYFGINWDARRRGLFTLLDREPWMEIYGPKHGWSYLTGSSYKGSVAFDGVSVIRRYREAGAALCLFSDRHFDDNIVTSRVFEASAAGAIMIAPRMPWLERHFGDSVLYIDQYAPDEQVVAQIARHMAWIRSNPDAARAMSTQTRDIFQSRFSLETLLSNVVKFHEEVQSATKRRPGHDLASIILVVAGDHSQDEVTRSLASVLKQDYPSKEVVIVFDSAARAAGYIETVEAGRPRDSKCRVEVVRDLPGSDPIAAGLERCTGDYLAILITGDEWMQGHLSAAFSALHAGRERTIVRSGVLVQRRREFTIEGGGRELRDLLPFPFSYPADDPIREADAIPLSSLVFHRSLLDAWALRTLASNAARELQLVASLLEQAVPDFTYRATCLVYEPNPGSTTQAKYSAHQEVLARAHTRFLGRSFGSSARPLTYDLLRRSVRRARLSSVRPGHEGRRGDGAVDYPLPADFLDSVSAPETWQQVPVAVTRDEIVLGWESTPPESGGVLPLVVQPPRAPWAEGLHWLLRWREECPHVIELRCRVESGMASISITGPHRSGTEYRLLVPSASEAVVVRLPISSPTEAGALVVQATDDEQAVRMVIEDVTLFAAEPRLPRAVTPRVLAENERLRAQLDEAVRERDHLHGELDASRRRVRQMRSSRAWQVGMLYWKLRSRVADLQTRARSRLAFRVGRFVGDHDR